MFKKKKVESIDELLDKEEGYNHEEELETQGNQEQQEKPTKMRVNNRQKQAKPRNNNTQTQGVSLFDIADEELPEIEEERERKGGKGRLVILLVAGVIFIGGGTVGYTMMNKDKETAPPTVVENPTDVENVETPIVEEVDNTEGLYEEEPDKDNDKETGKVIDEDGKVKESTEVDKESEEKEAETEPLTVEDVPIGGLTEYDKEVIRTEKFIKYTSEYSNTGLEHSDTWYVSERSHEGIQTIQQAVGEEADVSTFSLNKHKVEGVLPIVDFMLPNGGETMVLMQVGSEIERDKVVREQAKKDGDKLYLATSVPIAHAKLPSSFIGDNAVKDKEEPTKEEKETKGKEEEAKKEYAKLSEAYTFSGKNSKKLGTRTYNLKKYKFFNYGTPYVGYELSTKVGENTLYVMLYGMEEENLESALYRVEKMLITLEVK